MEETNRINSSYICKSHSRRQKIFKGLISMQYRNRDNKFEFVYFPCQTEYH